MNSDANSAALHFNRLFAALNIIENDMKIWDAIESDVSAIYTADNMATEEGSRRQHIRNWVNQGQAVVALIDNVVVGYAALEYTFFSNGFISMLMVDRTSRRKGVATALVKRLEKRCETDKLFTSTNESNKPMQRLMQSMSYETSGTAYNLDEGDPELFYVKEAWENQLTRTLFDLVTLFTFLCCPSIHL